MRILENTKINEEQRKTLTYLEGRIENLQVVQDEYSEDLIFEGDGIDGPSLGYINSTGVVSWLVCGC